MPKTIKRTIKKNTETLVSQSVFLNETDNTDDRWWWPFWKKIPQDHNHFHPDLSMTINPTTFEIYNGSGVENQKLQSFYET